MSQIDPKDTGYLVLQQIIRVKWPEIYEKVMTENSTGKKS